jgi:DNA primase
MTKDIRLAYDGDEAGVKATERAISLAGDLGINLTVISDYQGAKDPDELIQKDPKLWQEAVKKWEPAVEWLLNKYEEKLDLFSGDGKREYSDVAMKVINYISDSVERKHYEQMVARKLDVSVEDLREKKVGGAPRRKYYKEVKNKTVNGREKAVEDNLLALAVYGGVDVEMEIPDDETRLNELEIVYNERYKDFSDEELRNEAKILGAEYRKLHKKNKIEELQAKLEEADEEEMEKILREITMLQKE